MRELKEGLDQLRSQTTGGQATATEAQQLWGLLPAEIEVSLELSTEKNASSTYTLSVSPIKLLASSVGAEWVLADAQKAGSRMTIKFRNVVFEKDLVDPTLLEDLLKVLDANKLGPLDSGSAPK